jgi:hypothetical protein
MGRRSPAGACPRRVDGPTTRVEVRTTSEVVREDRKERVANMAIMATSGSAGGCGRDYVTTVEYIGGELSAPSVRAAAPAARHALP